MDFESVKNIAVVGLSNKPDRASYKVAKYLQECGYRIIPVNPTVDNVLGEKSYPDIDSVPHDITIDIVDIFRKPEAVMPFVQQAVNRADAGIIWMQEGIINEEAAKAARHAGLEVIMDTCILKEHQKCVLKYDQS